MKNSNAERVYNWLTGYDADALARHLDEKTTFRDFFAQAQLKTPMR